MGMESFYGGRMGASFVIVKQFDGIDIPQVSGSEVYKIKYLATTDDGQFFIYDTVNQCFIIRDEHNYLNYRWKQQALNGSTVDTKPDKAGTGATSQQVLDTVLAEGMIQCFERGGETTDIVNYGEYVIIDTPDKNNPENGKVYRRGMNFDRNENNSLAGAEYIGQIVGPQGSTPELGMDHYEQIIQDQSQYANVQTITYNQANLDIVPGYKDGVANDNIQLVSANFLDEFGTVKGCVIGFKTPTLVEDFDAESVSPYYHRDPVTGVSTDLIEEDPTQYQGGQWLHPFYQKWKIKVPRGYHGVNVTDLEKVHTKTMPKNYKQAGFPGASLWTDVDCTVPYNVGSAQGVLPNETTVLREQEGHIYLPTDPKIYDADDSVISCKVNYNGIELYVKKEDCYGDILRYKETSYDNQQTGEITYHDLGDFNNIYRMVMDAEGTITVYYTNGQPSASLPKALTWINDISLSQQGDFVVLFNNDKISGGRYYTTLDWVDHVELDNTGTLKFYYNTNHDYPAYQFDNVIEYFSDAEIETEDPILQKEGTGDQRIHLTFNSGREEIIGNPLNYIIETTISVPSVNYPDAPYSHLLVYYADPALRQTFSSKWVTYPSGKYPNEVWTQWVDLGDVRGDSGGLHILEDVASVNDLNTEPDGSGTWIPPEQLTDSHGTYINPEGAGWAVTITPVGSSTSTIYCFDYNDRIWYPIGSINPEAVSPESIITKSDAVGDTHLPPASVMNTLKENGFWFATETAYFAE